MVLESGRASVKICAQVKESERLHNRKKLPLCKENLLNNPEISFKPVNNNRNCAMKSNLLVKTKSNVAFSSNGQKSKPLRPIRRVRFDLPPSDSDMGFPDADDDGVVVNQTAGEGLLRTRATASYRPDILKHRYENQFLKNQIKNNRSEDNFYKHNRKYILDDVSVPLTSSPAPRYRIYPTSRYIRGTLSPTPNSVTPSSVSHGGNALLRAARDGDETTLRDLLHRATLVGILDTDLNAVDNSGRTTLSYIGSNGSVQLLNEILKLSSLNLNRPDNEGNTPLHFVAQAGHVECLNILLTRCTGIEIDARNNLGFTPLMKAALQGRNKCAKLLLFAGANPTLRDCGRGLRADQWARFCGRYVCADIIEKHARQRLLERSTSYGNWGVETDMSAKIVLGKVVPIPQIPQSQNGLKSRLKKVFRTSSGPSCNLDQVSSARLITQLTSAALCVSSPVLPSAPSVPPVVKSLIRPLTVPRLQVTLVNNNNDEYANKFYSENEMSKTKLPSEINDHTNLDGIIMNKPPRMKKKK